MTSTVEATRKLVLVIVSVAALAVAGGIAVAVYAPQSVPPGELRLAFSVATDRSTYTLGEVANVTVALTNVGNATAVLAFSDPCFWQFLAYDATDHVVFNYSYQRACIQMLAKVTLAPGQSVRYLVSWALVTDQGTPVPAPASYRLEPSFVWYQSQYASSVVRSDSATITVNP